MISIPVLLGAALVSGVSIGPAFLLLPIYALLLFLSAYSLAYILAVSFVFFRDLRHIMSIVMQIWFYGTPVVYNSKMIPEQFRFILFLNPVGLLFSGLNRVVTESEAPTPLHFTVTVAWTLFLVLASSYLHKTSSKNLVEQI
jgi:ABC-type polysaccharide/polyol phosphate export permease